MLFLKVAVFVLVLQLTRGMAIAQKANLTKVGSLYYLCLSVLYMFEVTHDMISLYMILWVMFFGCGFGMASVCGCGFSLWLLVL